ncbi:MAG: hypothetical protein VX185_15070 [Pseudomonadota bacterium]|nr:hypothetical protein [Pseudomonadota bacterium]
MKKLVQSILATSMVLGAVNAQAAWPENVNVSGDIIAELGVTTENAHPDTLLPLTP